ncbi:hypothetical protein AK812_SmicGene9328 [Symbiodinium microadriaticum]|uniref:Uncharacterized protein n=1 Tax=Symbiodinium microadriaticum TaxID=2951 RepID=A0A1Q9EIQ9_SYMMI|nr:hypothetical protein AK812_SmicGene9328 [Symbiodinium microadriaticum]
MASSELLGALNRRREMAEAAGAVFEGSPRASAADTVWDQHHETQFTPKGKHRLPDESRMQRIEQAEEESAGTITPPEEHSPPPGKVRAKESPAEKAARRARVSGFGEPAASESAKNDNPVEDASPPGAGPRSIAEPLVPPVQVQTQAASEAPAEEALPDGLDVTVACAEGAKVQEDQEVAGMQIPVSLTPRLCIIVVAKVSSEELLSVVVHELHQRCLGACVVEFDDGRLEFFDCADFNSLLAAWIASYE